MADAAGRRVGRLFQTLLSMSRGNTSDLVVAVFVVVIVAMLIIPLPPVILDLFMSINIVLALLTILIVLYTKHALEFSVFPTLLLISTVFGLALNVSSTRLILSQGATFGGRIVRAFGTFVVGAKGVEGYVIGIIIFAIIIAVQFIVITKGATRVAEVAARFTLDALPGKQMAIEGEYNSGLITEEEARRRKSEVQREVDFYGAMDGASKFISGNVKIGLLITVINIVGGFLVGTLIHGESLTVALDTYVSLTIGDGLVTQLPSLLISTATGIIVTRAASDRSFGQEVTAQFANQSRPYLIAAGLLLVMSVLPGFPFYVLIPLALIIGFLGVTLHRKKQAEAEKKPQGAAREEAPSPAEATRLAPLDPLSLELGYGLIPLVDKEHGAERRSGSWPGGSADPHHRQHAPRAKRVLLQDPGRRSGPRTDPAEHVPGHQLREGYRGDPGRGHPGPHVRAACDMDRRGGTRSSREPRIHGRGPLVHHRHASARGHQAPRRGDPGPAGGPVHPRRPQAGLSGGAGGAAEG